MPDTVKTGFVGIERSCYLLLNCLIVIFS